ncbi:MAG: hypothetical protein J0H66_14990 [Solirubrobacterales bacterium]|nr:hypothetical protein [Solirubrobacterales bacterium]OJU95107.1 MAG: hypothetical protein BGO23_10510 [Solirubrobacterales bacterium 67-14]
MHEKPIEPASRGIKITGLALLALTLAFGMIGLSGEAKASPVTLKFDNGRLTIGAIFDNATVLPASSTFPSDSLPTPQRTDIELNGDLTGSAITIPAATNTGAQFPYMHLMHPIEEGLRIPITMRLNEPGLTGTWDEATGAMTLEGKVDLIVVTGTGTTFPVPDGLGDLGVPPLGLFARCRINDVPMSFSTATQQPTTGEPFTGGFGVHGALTAAWDALPEATSENGGDCGDLNKLIPVPGGLWLSNAIVEPKPQPGPPDPTCETDFTLCPPPRFTEIDGVRLKPGRKKVKPGKKVVLTLRVHNSGNVAARKIKVKIKVKGRRVRAPRTVTLTVPAKRWAKKRFAVKVKRHAKRRVVVIASNNGWSGRTYLKVR